MDIALRSKFSKAAGYQIPFWIALLLFGVARNYGEHDYPDFRELFYYDFCHWIFQVIGANFIYFILVRKYFDSGRYFDCTVFLLMSLYILGVMNRIFIVYLAEPLFADYPQDSLADIFTDIQYLLFCYILPIISGAFIFTSIMFMLRYKNEKHSRLQLQKEKAELELKVLKSQLNPHFLFNTLNNIYSLALSDSEATAPSVGRLSDILDYVLGKGQHKMISVSEEMKIIRDYIGLEKLRYDERLTVEVLEKVPFPASVPPLLYLSLVENAFKHGAEKTGGKVEIFISLVSGPESAVFHVENSCSGNKTEEGLGIGLQNVRQQLELYYAGRYSFDLEKRKDRFLITIKTPLQND
ncbi:sensor histidine kinase [uncultured Chryseobacterium sp.]|uniref:sensor histidine kinase n=1 Tax=uncultured Chryseobacterium sp. TaxID=259322 RepID=UPI0025E30A38|nr:sensor histidine kinase [uncultured Chryseobacterium sp.]